MKPVRLVSIALCCGLLCLGSMFLACGGEVSVTFPGCEECPERCLRNGNVGRCVDCIKDEQCQSKTSPTKRCIENRCHCGSEKDCEAGKVCDGTKGCVECKENSHCKSKDRPICLERTCVACTPGESQACAPEGLTVCVKGTQTCKPSGSWGTCENAVSCQTGERCINSKCLPACPDPAPCQKDEKQCTTAAGAYPGKYKECKLNDIQCYEFAKEEKFCDKKEVCEKGACIPFTCPAAECKEGETRCVDDDTQQTCGRDKDNCVIWLPSKACPTGEKCRKSTNQCTLCEPKATRECYDDDAKTKGIGECKAGVQTCKEDGSVWSGCVNQVLPKTDVCNGKDDDCDGAVDEDFAKLGTECTVGKGECENKGKYVCTSDEKDVACNVKPKSSAQELCNGKDDNCDGQVDESFPDLNKKCKAGKGICEAEGTYICKLDGSGVVCDAQTGTPGTETCNGKDDNCDGQVDEKLTRQCYTGSTGCEKVQGTDFYKCQGVCSFGIQSCAGGQWTACAKEVLPQTAEACNGKDDNCDGTVDEGNPGGGGDCLIQGKFAECAKGKNACQNGQIVCTQVNLPKTELCNNKDDDCDGKIDNNIPTQTFYPDDDKDKYGSAAAKGVTICKERAPTGWVTNNKDCDDNNDKINPDATDICDGIDNNCNKSVDEGNVRRNWYRDADKDTYGDKTVIFTGCSKNSTTVCTGLQSCRSNAGYVTNNSDCCDKDNRVKPGQTSYYGSANNCGNFDYNCDGKSTPQYTLCQCSRSAVYYRDGYTDTWRQDQSWIRWYTRSKLTNTYSNSTCELNLSTSLEASGQATRSCSAKWCSKKILGVCVTYKSCSTHCTLYGSYTKRSWTPRASGSQKYIMWVRSKYSAGCAYRVDGNPVNCGDTVQRAGSLASSVNYSTAGTSQVTRTGSCDGHCNKECRSRYSWNFSMNNTTYAYSAPTSSFKLPCR